MRVLGVDPGSSATGFGLIEREGGQLRPLRHGVLRPPAGGDLSIRLEFLHRRLFEIATQEKPTVAVVERVFMASNARSALVLGQARGALLASLGSAGVRVVEVAAREAKQSVTGHGGADKNQVKAMVTRLLGLLSEPPSDAADALALALTHAQAGALAGLPIVRRASRKRRRESMAQLVEERTR